MECYYHPSRESTDNCAICGKSICKECGLEIAGKVYCKECLEKIVGLSLSNTPEPAPEPPKQEPVRLQREEQPEVQIEMANLTREPPAETQKIADDSPYNIKDNIQYEGGLESSYQEVPPVREAPEPPVMEEPEIVPQKPVENVREEYIPQEPVRQARNEYDYAEQPQAQKSQDYIYPDHSYQPQETSARRSLEDKYERYLDDLYFDEEDEVPLNEQLARDEAKFGSLTKNEYKPRKNREIIEEEDELERRIREELMREKQEKEQAKGGLLRRKKTQQVPEQEKIHNFEYEDEKEPLGVVDILLTINLVIVILVVLYYIVYLFFLSSTYPTFIDAIMGLKDPGTLISNFSH